MVGLVFPDCVGLVGAGVCADGSGLVGACGTGLVGLVGAGVSVAVGVGVAVLDATAGDEGLGCSAGVSEPSTSEEGKVTFTSWLATTSSSTSVTGVIAVGDSLRPSSTGNSGLGCCDGSPLFAMLGDGDTGVGLSCTGVTSGDTRLPASTGDCVLSASGSVEAMSLSDCVIGLSGDVSCGSSASLFSTSTLSPSDGDGLLFEGMDGLGPAGVVPFSGATLAAELFPLPGLVLLPSSVSSCGSAGTSSADAGLFPSGLADFDGEAGVDGVSFFDVGLVGVDAGVDLLSRATTTGLSFPVVKAATTGVARSNSGLDC